MKVILGLGNPGNEYISTRHNAGILLVDAIFNYQFLIFKDTYGWRRKKQIMMAEFPELILVKTAGYFMNESGGVIKEFLRNSSYPLDNIYLAHDDLDIKLGEYKIQFGTGPKVHNGVESVENALETKEFWRIRMGIDNRVQKIPGDEYVLQRFTREEKVILERALNAIYQANFK